MNAEQYERLCDRNSIDLALKSLRSITKKSEKVKHAITLLDDEFTMLKQQVRNDQLGISDPTLKG